MLFSKFWTINKILPRANILKFTSNNLKHTKKIIKYNLSFNIKKKAPNIWSFSCLSKMIIFY
ncbi:hypothetical protein B0A65_16685 [Flavobacterium frigidimaris]|uniref:Uncharacterized protein n=1 Tax=Flavobacterium frigidimaris TaxID=262320 RepID=A0ABX4BLZ8_FLAFR|nr:hypothetical protein B0A65_16685 [Flavobacterium frigidimaris]